MAEYRVGPSDFFTPGDLHADADTLNGQVDALDAVYESGGGDPSADLQDAWARFTAQWHAFYRSAFGSFWDDLATAVNNSNRDQLIQYEQRFEALRVQMASAGISATAANQVQPKDDSFFGAGLLGMIALVIGLVIALIVLKDKL